ncbi:hypothetical protein MYSTI_07699 [Myxococcus stipitatus DSM 14675]|uniref:Lipoprotein n=1 Tax=Myxococcus stipitatus (strain DSM 14675 / JCM 12634 / Mx s8) TaxID=1278073 RepID=L7UJ28_MYXSD|nr:hypothetical protein [Myxococcus stipitatus]AGC48971.1 hypothetical protein MYSTI_07699 [Myxococcus stipitatus DSM 14675]
MRKLLAYAGTALVIAAVLSWPMADPSPEGERRQGDYHEECQSEGCDTEELRELHASYASECLDEGCSPEEVIELAGHPDAVDAMRAAFQQHGWRIDPKHFPACRLELTETSCALLALLCKDHYLCLDGAQESAWYGCGFCVGIGSCAAGGGGTKGAR